MNLIGSSFQRIGQLEKAKKIFEDIVALDRSNTAALNNLGNTYKSLKDFDSAEKAYKQALEIEPNFANCIQNLTNFATPCSIGKLALFNIKSQQYTSDISKISFVGLFFNFFFLENKKLDTLKLPTFINFLIF